MDYMSRSENHSSGVNTPIPKVKITHLESMVLASLIFK
ncbi:MAG: Unknown protein [uncultured Sulfurovum sp.]|uniref:Uncharacterized protein n=1 Tax=uncultured Sulfurovum sp. TaxID=269237 RepID=A0A6S6SH61_9BACT|nr:MAG: Unknown protein [uncultured Sulfurovum sp.]